MMHCAPLSSSPLVLSLHGPVDVLLLLFVVASYISITFSRVIHKIRNKWFCQEERSPRMHVTRVRGLLNLDH